MVSIRKRYPDVKITLLTATSPAYRIKSHPAYVGNVALPWLLFMVPAVINEAICVHSFDLKSLWMNIRRRVGELNPDLAVILAHPGEPGLGLFKKIVFLRFLGVRGRIYGWRTNSSIRWFRQMQYNAGLFEHHVIGPLRSVAELPDMPQIDVANIKFPLNLDLTARPWVASLWRKNGWIDRSIVAIAPGSMQPHKRWPLERFISLCQELMLNFDVFFIIIGTSEDKLLGQQLVDAVDRKAVSFAGETSLSQSTAILERCSLLVGNDGGAMHLGSAMGIPVVSIVPGIEYPNSIEPWFSRELAVRHSVPCAPCYNFTHCPLKHNKCIKELPVHDVYEKCIQVLKKGSTINQH
jgi:heptosyltransferase-2